MNCPDCQSRHIKKNGHTHHGKQNYQCTNCWRQFVAAGQSWFNSTADKELIN
ncbi:IS1/IS1595 family N-terminal zinc-binding domain-containing protein [Hymenobacter nivis]|uniref:IS1/IS1595 family N-terminal zinc-binding domain-containing protein n=1 Tax=Hymenobacter nivis TaxID=1850093 RepID=UPI003F693482